MANHSTCYKSNTNKENAWASAFGYALKFYDMKYTTWTQSTTRLLIFSSMKTIIYVPFSWFHNLRRLNMLMQIT